MTPFIAICGGIILLPTLLVGGNLTLRAGTPLRRMAGLLTLKPFVTTPLWIMILLIMTDRYNDSPTLVAAALAVVAFRGLDDLLVAGVGDLAGRDASHGGCLLSLV